MDEKMEKCYCGLIQAHKNIPVTAWEDFEAKRTARQSQKEAASAKGKNAKWNTKSRYGYETLDDKYKFVHYEDISMYMEDYSDMFSIANRTHKKWRPNPYKTYKAASHPSYSMRLPVRDITKPQYKLDIQEIPGTTGGLESPILSIASRQEEDLKDDVDTATPANSARSSRTAYPGDDNGDTELEAIMMRAAPGLGKEYGRVDSVKDAVCDENEDSEEFLSANAPKIPLLKQLNTFFLSRNGLKRTNYTPMAAQTQSSANRFPLITSRSAGGESYNSTLTDMTAASIINYRVPPDTYRPQTHHKITVQNHVDAKHPMVRTMLERQKTQLLPLKMRAMANSSINKTGNYHDVNHSAKQTTNQKRFNALNLKPSAPSVPAAPSNDKGLSRNHILKAKNISKANGTGSKDLILDNRKQTNGAKSSNTESKIDTELRCGSENSQRAREEQRKEVSDFILTYGHKSLHPYLSSAIESSTFTTVGKSYSKAELVDYSTIMDNRYQS